MDFEAMFNNAVADYESGNYAGALAAFKQLAQVKPFASEVHLNMGNAHFRLSEIPAAEACFRKALELDPLELNAYLNLGNLYFKQSNVEQAVDCWESYKALNKRNANVWLNLGLAYDQLGEPENAAENYSVFMGLSPTSTEAGQLKSRFDGARRMFEHNVKVAEEMLSRGRAEEARHILQKALAAYPGNATLYKTYASLLYQDAQYDEALIYYRRAHALKTDDPGVLINLGVLHEKLGQPMQALWAYHQAAALSGPEQAKVSQRFEALLARHRQGLAEALSQAQTLFRQGRLRRAEEMLTQLVDLSPYLGPNAPEAQEWLEKVQEARDPNRRAIKTYFNKGVDAEANGRFDQALMFYQKFLKMQPEGPQAETVRRKLAHLNSLMSAVVQSLLDNS